MASCGALMASVGFWSRVKEAGEVIQAKLLPDQVVELGELFMLKREAERQARERGERVEGGCQFKDGQKGEGGLHEWLTRGNVIYKSVGLGLERRTHASRR